MGLRDAIDAGKGDIKSTAEEVIVSLNIEEQIRQAVVLNRSSISVSFNKSNNMYIIQQEVVRQIVEEGFQVKWEKSCCSEADIGKLRKIRRRTSTGTIYYDVDFCKICRTEFEEDYSGDVARYGRITISWY